MPAVASLSVPPRFLIPAPFLLLLAAAPLSVLAASPLDDLSSDAARGGYCLYARTMQLQVSALGGGGPRDAAEEARLLEDWQQKAAQLMRAEGRGRQPLAEAQRAVTERLASAQDAAAYAGVFGAVQAACDQLFSRVQLAGAAVQPPPPTRPATVPQPGPKTDRTGPVPATQTGPASLDELLAEPLEGRFYWNWYSTEDANVRTRGRLQQTSPAGAPLAFELNFESRITKLCVEPLKEIRRSVDGYLLHLAVAPAPESPCRPRVTRALLSPHVSGSGAGASASISLRLYDAAGRLVSASLMRSKALTGARVDAERARRAIASVQETEAQAKQNVKDQRLRDFRARPDYAQLGPFYEACLGAAGSIADVGEAQPYCLCMSKKFGIGERIPAAEFARYTRDFSQLVARFSGPQTESNKLYVRLAETCRSCSYAGSELKPYCDSEDSLLYVARTYDDMLRLLAREPLRVEASTFYKSVFFRTYLQGYSIYCRDAVVDPVRFDYVVTEYDLGNPWSDPDGQVVQHTKTYVTRRYAERYQRIYDELSAIKPGSVSAMLEGAAVRNAAELRSRVRDLKRQIETEVNRRQAIQRHLEGQCRSPVVQQVYDNLDRLVP